MQVQQVQRVGRPSASASSCAAVSIRCARRVCCKASQQSSSSDASTSTSAPAADQLPVTREFTALGSKVVETNVPFKGPEDSTDFWEGEQFEAFGKALENYFVPGLIALGLVCGGIAAKTYNDGATAFVKPASGPDTEASIIIAIPDAAEGAPSPSS